MDENVFPPANENDPIGDAQPVLESQTFGEEEPSLLGECWIFFKGTLVIGGSAIALLVTYALLNPSRTSGASRSARLQWQNRQTEIREVIQQQETAQANVDALPKGTADSRYE